MFTRRVLYNTYVLPALTYAAAETWALRPSAWQAFGAVHNSFLRFMAGVHCGPDCPSNEELYRRVGSWPLLVHIDQCRLRFLGHVCRMTDDSLPKSMLFGRQLHGVPRALGAGLPPPRWWHRVWESLRRLGLAVDAESWFPHTQSREAWREHVQRLPAVMGT